MAPTMFPSNQTQTVTGWAAHDPSGKITPYTFKRRYNLDLCTMYPRKEMNFMSNSILNTNLSARVFFFYVCIYRDSSWCRKLILRFQVQISSTIFLFFDFP